MGNKNQITKYEKETVINFNDGEPLASVYTYNKALIRQLKKLEDEKDDASQTKNYGMGCFSFSIPKEWIKIRPGRTLSQEEKQKRAEQMKKNIGFKG